MPYFTHGDVKNKLILLYIFHCAQKPLPKEHLYRAVYDNECMPYFTFETVLQELEDDGLITAVTRPFGDCFGMTELGRESVKLFEGTLPLSLRVILAEYMEAHGAEFARELQTVSSMTPSRSGGYSVRLSVIEQDEVFFGITISVASKEDALRIRRHWEAKSVKLYSEIWDKLWTPSGDGSDQ